jgi:hypothetical protein
MTPTQWEWLIQVVAGGNPATIVRYLVDLQLPRETGDRILAALPNEMRSAVTRMVHQQDASPVAPAEAQQAVINLRRQVENDVAVQIQSGNPNQIVEAMALLPEERRRLLLYDAMPPRMRETLIRLYRARISNQNPGPVVLMDEDRRATLDNLRNPTAGRPAAPMPAPPQPDPRRQAEIDTARQIEIGAPDQILQAMALLPEDRRRFLLYDAMPARMLETLIRLYQARISNQAPGHVVIMDEDRRATLDNLRNPTAGRPAAAGQPAARGSPAASRADVDLVVNRVMDGLQALIRARTSQSRQAGSSSAGQAQNQEIEGIHGIRNLFLNAVRNSVAYAPAINAVALFQQVMGALRADQVPEYYCALIQGWVENRAGVQSNPIEILDSPEPESALSGGVRVGPTGIKGIARELLPPTGNPFFDDLPENVTRSHNRKYRPSDTYLLKLRELVRHSNTNETAVEILLLTDSRLSRGDISECLYGIGISTASGNPFIGGLSVVRARLGISDSPRKAR